MSTKEYIVKLGVGGRMTKLLKRRVRIPFWPLAGVVRGSREFNALATLANLYTFACVDF